HAVRARRRRHPRRDPPRPRRRRPARRRRDESEERRAVDEPARGPAARARPARPDGGRPRRRGPRRLPPPARPLLPPDRPRGASAVEFGLCMPALLLIIAGTTYIGRALNARGRLVDAVGYAARAGVIAAGKDANGAVPDGLVQQAVEKKLSGESNCRQLVVTATPALTPVRHLDVHAECTLAAPLFGGNFGLTRISADASMPIDVSVTN